MKRQEVVEYLRCMPDDQLRLVVKKHSRDSAIYARRAAELQSWADAGRKILTRRKRERGDEVKANC